ARAARRRREPPRARRVVTTIAVAAGLCVLALLLIPSKRSESLGPVLVQTKAPPRGQPYRLLDGFSRLPVTHDRLTGPAGPHDAALATLILDTAPPPEAADVYLAAAAVPETILAGASTRTISPPMRLLTIG